VRRRPESGVRFTDSLKEGSDAMSNRGRYAASTAKTRSRNKYER
jgi:hypothetical protein